jgi:hypothetical protein
MSITEKEFLMRAALQYPSLYQFKVIRDIEDAIIFDRKITTEWKRIIRALKSVLPMIDSGPIPSLEEKKNRIFKDAPRDIIRMDIKHYGEYRKKMRQIDEEINAEIIAYFLIHGVQIGEWSYLNY